jgi:hypothetical protein
VTNITNIIYNFNLTPTQQMNKHQIEQQMLLQQEAGPPNQEQRRNNQT